MLSVDVKFLVFWFIYLSFPLDHFKNGPEFYTRETAQLFISLMIFLPQSLVFFHFCLFDGIRFHLYFFPFLLSIFSVFLSLLMLLLLKLAAVISSSLLFLMWSSSPWINESTRSSILAYPLPSFFFEAQCLCVSYLGCKDLCMVISFLVPHYFNPWGFFSPVFTRVWVTVIFLRSLGFL